MQAILRMAGWIETGSGERTERIHDAHCDWTRRELRSLYDQLSSCAPPHHLHRRPSEPSSRVARSRDGGGDGDRYSTLTFLFLFGYLLGCTNEKNHSFLMSAVCSDFFPPFIENQFGGFVQNSRAQIRKTIKTRKSMRNLSSIAIRLLSLIPQLDS